MPKGNGWWTVDITCPTCENETILKQVEFTATGEIGFISYCPNCEQGCRWITTGHNLQRIADKFNSQENECHVGPPSQKETEEEDAKFLKRCFIKPP